MNAKLSEVLGFALALEGADLAGGATTNYVNVVDIRLVCLVLLAAAAAEDATITVQFRAAEDASGTNAVDLGDVMTLTAGAGPLKVHADRVIAGLPEGLTYVAAVVTAVDSPVPAALNSVSGTFVLGDRRYNP